MLLVNDRIAKNLALLRKKRNLSLDDVAQLTGVSKPTLGQIERGDANPTVNTLWKIANGLKVSFSSLVEEDPQAVSLVTFANRQPTIEEPGYRLYPVFSFDAKKRFEIFVVNLGPRSEHASEGHPQGTEEYLIMHVGRMTVEAGGEAYELTEGDAMHFGADVPHLYRNMDSRSTRYSILIYYNE